MAQIHSTTFEHVTSFHRNTMIARRCRLGALQGKKEEKKHILLERGNDIDNIQTCNEYNNPNVRSGVRRTSRCPKEAGLRAESNLRRRLRREITFSVERTPIDNITKQKCIYSGMQIAHLKTDDLRIRRSTTLHLNLKGHIQAFLNSRRETLSKMQSKNGRSRLRYDGNARRKTTNEKLHFVTAKRRRNMITLRGREKITTV
ncbi:hypothetical protein BJ165DRAFT_1536491 [Panaeolus papilionaceus]|nr:hypothetical protein BJ165DRAFT_1536491 [Panaeolus papilionaceus]